MLETWSNIDMHNVIKYLYGNLLPICGGVLSTCNIMGVDAHMMK